MDIDILLNLGGMDVHHMSVTPWCFPISFYLVRCLFWKGCGGRPYETFVFI